MRRPSLRSWLLSVFVVFAVVTVGAISLVTYVVVEDGMATVAGNAASYLGDVAPRIAIEKAAEATDSARQQGLSGPELDTASDRAFVHLLYERFRLRGSTQSEYALYNEDLNAVWETSGRALLPSAGEAREEALTGRRTTYTAVSRSGALRGLFSSARLDVQTVHVPVTMPSGERAVLDIAYFPDREEQAMDSIRLPMATLAVAAMLIIILVMQTSMTWVLRRVNHLREAADAVDAGKLDVRIPEQGSNEIGDLARSINRLIDRLRRRADAQTRFVADASHELATPVAGIRGYTNILRAWGADDPEVRDEAIGAIDRESRRMARLTNNLLTLVRSEQSLELRSVRFDLNMSCREVLSVASTRYTEKNQHLIGPDEGPLMMIGDPERTEDVISILVDNAANYTPERGRVTLLTRRKRDQVVIEVSDTGPGIPATDLSNIFERFYRSDASRSRGTGGFGLGLAIAKSLIQELDGTIEVKSELGRGTTFTVRLPRGRV